MKEKILQRQEKKIFFGLVKYIFEPNDNLDWYIPVKPYWYEWYGPKNLFLVRIILFFLKEKSIFIPNYGWLFLDKNFFGDGLGFFQK